MEEERSQFTFYRSYYEAVRGLCKRDRLAALDAVIAYALDGAEPENLTPVQFAVFRLIQPTLNTGRKMAIGGMRSKKGNDKVGKSSGKGKGKVGESIGKGSGKEKEVEVEKEGEKEVEKEGEKEVEKEDEGLKKGREAVAAVQKVYRERINPAPSPACLEELKGYAEQMGAACCLRAFDIALDNKKATWPYIRAILRTKHAQGVRRLADWDALERKREEEKQDPFAASRKRLEDKAIVKFGPRTLDEDEKDAIRRIMERADG